MATFLDDPGNFEEFIDKFLAGNGENLKKIFIKNFLSWPIYAFLTHIKITVIHKTDAIKFEIYNKSIAQCFLESGPTM